MQDEPPFEAMPAPVHDQPPPVGFLPQLQILAAICLLVATFLPWITWGLRYQESAGLGVNYSLWQALFNDVPGDLGANWMYGVVAGTGLAAMGSIVEAFRRPAGKWPRWLAASGFALAAGASCFGIVSALGQPATNPNDPVGGAIFGPAVGLWAGFLLAAAGVALSVVHLSSPANPEHVPEPFAPSPWGPLPGVVPPGFHPALGPDWVDYIERGEVPPGYVPPSYGPPIYPTPGYVAPAYTAPERPDPDWPTSEFADFTSAASSAPGRLVVAEAGRSTSYIVKPGQRLLIGRDPDAQIRVSDPRVGARHATVERREDGWAVQDVDARRPTRLIDPWGTNRPVRGEIAVPAGQLVMGGVTVTLFPTHG
jgi:hypothetical protein